MLYGLIAAAGWDTSSVAAAHAARRMGTLVSLLISQATGTLVLIGALADVHPHLLALPTPAILGLIGAGILVTSVRKIDLPKCSLVDPGARSGRGYHLDRKIMTRR